MTKLRIWSLFLLLLGICSCVDQISFPLEKADTERLIVSGLITDGKGTKRIYLSTTTAANRPPLLVNGYLTQNDAPRPVQNAQITLWRAGQPLLGASFQEVRPGIYEYELEEPLEGGISYFVEIKAGGKTYRSALQVMPSISGEDQLSFSFERARIADNPDAAQLILKTELTLPQVTGEYYLRWSVEEAYFWDLTFFPNPFNKPPPNCIVFAYPDPERITLVNGKVLNRPGGKSTQVIAQRLVDQSFLSRHYFMVNQLSITKEAYTYWQNVREVVNNSGSVFDSPPAAIRGNVSNLNDPKEVVLGFLEIAKSQETRIFTTRGDVPYFLEKTCEYIPGKRYDQYLPTCLSCAAFPNSTEEYPAWWFKD